jgi:hypothetical protein
MRRDHVTQKSQALLFEMKDKDLFSERGSLGEGEELL